MTGGIIEHDKSIKSIFIANQHDLREDQQGYVILTDMVDKILYINIQLKAVDSHYCEKKRTIIRDIIAEITRLNIEEFSQVIIIGDSYIDLSMRRDGSDKREVSFLIIDLMEGFCDHGLYFSELALPAYKLFSRGGYAIFRDLSTEKHSEIIIEFTRKYEVFSSMCMNTDVMSMHAQLENKSPKFIDYQSIDSDRGGPFDYPISTIQLPLYSSKQLTVFIVNLFYNYFRKNPNLQWQERYAQLIYALHAKMDRLILHHEKDFFLIPEEFLDINRKNILNAELHSIAQMICFTLLHTLQGNFASSDFIYNVKVIIKQELAKHYQNIEKLLLHNVFQDRQKNKIYCLLSDLFCCVKLDGNKSVNKSADQWLKESFCDVSVDESMSLENTATHCSLERVKRANQTRLDDFEYMHQLLQEIKNTATDDGPSCLYLCDLHCGIHKDHGLVKAEGVEEILVVDNNCSLDMWQGLIYMQDILNISDSSERDSRIDALSGDIIVIKDVLRDPNLQSDVFPVGFERLQWKRFIIDKLQQQLDNQQAIKRKITQQSNEIDKLHAWFNISKALIFVGLMLSSRPYMMTVAMLGGFHQLASLWGKKSQNHLVTTCIEKNLKMS